MPAHRESVLPFRCNVRHHDRRSVHNRRRESPREASMSRITPLRRTAADHPVWTFLAVTVAYSAFVFGGFYAAFGTDLPSLTALPYAWGPLIAAGVTVWIVDESVRDWLGQLRNLRVGVH
jgi:hypothetical protein